MDFNNDEWLDIINSLDSKSLYILKLYNENKEVSKKDLRKLFRKIMMTIK